MKLLHGYSVLGWNSSDDVDIFGWNRSDDEVDIFEKIGRNRDDEKVRILDCFFVEHWLLSFRDLLLLHQAPFLLLGQLYEDVLCSLSFLRRDGLETDQLAFL